MQKKLELKQKKIDAGLVSEKFPKVSNIEIQMTYYQKMANPVLMERTVYFAPDSYAYFHMQCMMKECAEGGFNMAPAITKIIKGRKKSVKGKLSCRGKGDKLPSDHASISYEIKIKYKTKRK
jgi:hypothetical protein